MTQDPYLPWGVTNRDIDEQGEEPKCEACGMVCDDGALCFQCRWDGLLDEPVIYTVFHPERNGVRRIVEQREDTIQILNVCRGRIVARSAHFVHRIDEALGMFA